MRGNTTTIATDTTDTTTTKTRHANTSTYPNRTSLPSLSLSLSLAPSTVFPTLVELAGLPDIPARCETDLMSLTDPNCTEGASLAALIDPDLNRGDGAEKGKVS